MTEPKDARPIAADGMLHPVAWIAAALLVLNDHVLKAAWPGTVTGKLSDVAGLALFPLLLQGVWELLQRARVGRTVRSRSVFFLAAALTAVGFTLVKVVPACAEAYRWGLGASRWPLYVVLDWARDAPIHGVRRVMLARDVTDLVALPAVLLGLLANPRGRCLRLASSGVVIMLCLLISGPAAAEEDKTVLAHLRASVGPSGLFARWSTTAYLKSPTRDAHGSYTTSYGGTGLTLEIGPGVSAGDITYELFTIQLDWYGGRYFASDTLHLDRMNSELAPRLRALGMGFGVAWPLVAGSRWRMGAAAGYGTLIPDFRTAEGQVDTDTGFVTAAVSLGPRWPLVTTGGHPQSAVTLGLHARVAGGIGLEGGFASAALLGDLAFQ